RNLARCGVARLCGCCARPVRRRRQGGRRLRFPARARQSVRTADPAGRPLPRRAEPQLADRIDQSLPSDQAPATYITSHANQDRNGGAEVRTPERPTIGVKSPEFRRAREAGWVELEGLVEAVEKRGMRTLTPDQLQQLPLLYRSTLSSLSVARAIALDRHLLLYLENLALRAFLAVYSPPARFLE